ncbi:hypothetical protein, conserved [Eimeria acervulina]|uniref:Transmembrane protein n=1 Tax=Eimeria acervulina TaxID=5801 RepID=U6GNF2_EIMAC|nr:hypothetical protein, conserved [Eimeria acervulina]CDI81746.1 hypothetical protein, conserved [Eimeria acervulina]
MAKSESPDTSSSRSSRSSQGFVPLGEGIRRRGPHAGRRGPRFSSVTEGPAGPGEGPEGTPPVFVKRESDKKDSPVFKSPMQGRSSAASPASDALHAFGDSKEERGAPPGAHCNANPSSSWYPPANNEDSFSDSPQNSETRRQSVRSPPQWPPKRGPTGAPRGVWGLRGPPGEDNNQASPHGLNFAYSSPQTDTREQHTGEEGRHMAGAVRPLSIREGLQLLQQIVAGVAASGRLWASSLLGVAKWCCIILFAMLLLLGCLSCFFLLAAATSYYLLFSYTSPPPLHQFPVYFDYYPAVGLALTSQHREPSNPLPFDELRAGGPPSSWGPQAPAGEEDNSKSKNEVPPSPFSQATTPAAAAAAGAAASCGVSGGLLHAFDPLGAPQGAPQRASWGPQGGPIPWRGAPGGPSDLRGGPPGESWPSFEQSLAVATIPFSNRTWELLPEDGDLFAAPLPCVSSHWQHCQEQQQQQQQQQQQERQQFVSLSLLDSEEKAKVPSFASDFVLKQQLRKRDTNDRGP